MENILIFCYVDMGFFLEYVVLNYYLNEKWITLATELDLTICML